jgi:hypothetical protein
MSDQSHLDAKYFIDAAVYNCPYCNRRNVTYAVDGFKKFSWSSSKTAYAMFVKCRSCSETSMHLTFEEIVVYRNGYLFKDEVVGTIDDYLFYSVPSSFHVVDERIPRGLRQLLSEADGCLKSNFLTGASACARKVVYELAVKYQAEGGNYDERIKSLKDKLPTVDPTYFDTLLTIQQVTSDKVHEGSYDGWDSGHLRLVLAALHEVMQEIFVLPKVRDEKRKAILELKNQVMMAKQPAKAKGEGSA